MLLDRHRVARLVELSALEPILKGPERTLRSADVAVLVQAAYHDATDEARAAFMARVQAMPTSAWPWSAVQATTTRGGGGGGGTLGGLVAAPKPGTSTTPAALILIRGQAESDSVDPGDRLPDRGSPGALEWEPLYKALDTWDTQTILKSIGAQGWISMLGTSTGSVPKDQGATSGTPAGSTSGAPAGTTGPTAGTSDTTSGKAPNGPGDLPAPQPTPTPALSWKHPAVFTAGAAVVLVGGIALYTLTQDRRRSRLEEALGQQEEVP